MANITSGIGRYIGRNIVFLMAGMYLLLSVFLEAYFNIDICIPCIWKSMTGNDCVGCGLTTATIMLIKGDVIAAYQSNPVIFLVIPASIIYIIIDIKREIKLATHHNSSNNEERAIISDDNIINERIIHPESNMYYD